MRPGFQTAISVVFPPRCVGCGGMVESDFALCGACWGQTPFIVGLVCDACGVPLPGVSDGVAVQCDDCLKTPRPWTAGRAALLYRDLGRRMVLALKHGGRAEIALASAAWMQRAGADLFDKDMLIAPVPLHWTRLFHRTFNQSALLAHALADRTGHATCPDLLLRGRKTQPLDHKTVVERFDVLENAIKVHPRRRKQLADRPVLLIDDVMTSGATLTAATHACLAAGSGPVFTLTLARVAKDT
ncbi:ComF family protein [Aestuariivita sp.]|uniref:ComF family protein n=1 Tax=Aestuariivita sp. TaxID=1872407 RepID=UPI003435BBC7